MKNFTDLGLAEPILRALNAEGYETPTPIQAQAIPVFCDGQDVVGIAQTGTGKTAAFTLPILNRIIQAKRNRAPKTCSALIITPTRELAAQIVGNIQTYAKFTKLNVALIVGGVRPNGQVKAMKGGVDIVVATPGRLLDHMNTGAISLDHTHSVVLDEADQMMDLGFLPGIRKIMQSLPQERMTGLFSATMPREIRRLANDFLKDPAEVAVAAVSRPIERIEQRVKLVSKSDKRKVLTETLVQEEVGRTVVFTRTKRGADRVCAHLKDAELSAVAIHGDRTQNQRERALKQFRGGKVDILVATDIAARGIDIDDISHVINFDLPEVPEAYVHRIGRTARAGRSGVAISLCDPSEYHLLRAIEKLTGNKIPGAPSEKKNKTPREEHTNDNLPDRQDAKKPRKGRPFRHRNKSEAGEGSRRGPANKGSKANNFANGSQNTKKPQAAKGRRFNKRAQTKRTGPRTAA